MNGLRDPLAGKTTFEAGNYHAPPTKYGSRKTKSCGIRRNPMHQAHLRKEILLNLYEAFFFSEV